MFILKKHNSNKQLINKSKSLKLIITYTSLNNKEDLNNSNIT